jgi:hypothetical protein
MPMVKARAGTPDGLLDIAHIGDKTVFTHVQNVDPVSKLAWEQRNSGNNGWTKDKSMRKIAEIPELVFFANPQLTNPDGRINKAELRKFLRSPQGETFRTVDKGI